MAQTTQMITRRDLGGVTIYAPYPSNATYDGLFSANVAQTVTAPRDWSTFVAIFACSNGANFKVSINGTASFASGAIALTNGTLNPADLIVNSGDTLSIIADQASTKIMVAFRGLDPL